MAVIREAAVADQFYPGSASELSSTVQQYLDEVEAQTGPQPKALIVPLEKGIDNLSLQNGARFHSPFDVVPIFV